MIQNTRPVMADQSYKSSPFYNGKDGLVSRLEEAMSWDEAAKDLSQKQGIQNEKPYQGFSDRDTDITRRIANQTFQPNHTSEYRTQEILGDVLKEQAQRLKEELAAQKKYEKEMRDYL